eukprot:768761-Hanusia_phi.AAC.1
MKGISSRSTLILVFPGDVMYTLKHIKRLVEICMATNGFSFPNLQVIRSGLMNGPPTRVTSCCMPIIEISGITRSTFARPM